jgi:hypothetical protein
MNPLQVQNETKKKTLAVCGDSWFSSDLRFPGKSFGEILSASLDWDFVSLARAGCSNFAICLQIDKAIELNVDFVIVGTTTPDRSEFPIIHDQNVSIWQKLKESFNWHNCTQPGVYVKSQGISNVLHSNSLSMNNAWISNPTIISESLNNLVFWKNTKLSAKQIESLKHYMLNLYDSQIKRQYDSWIISDACRRLEESGIPYLIFTHSLYDSDFFSDIKWIDQNKILTQSLQSIGDIGVSDVTIFHYDHDQGGKIFANYVEEKIKNCYNITKDQTV